MTNQRYTVTIADQEGTVVGSFDVECPHYNRVRAAISHGLLHENLGSCDDCDTFMPWEALVSTHELRVYDLMPKVVCPACAGKYNKESNNVG